MVKEYIIYRAHGKPITIRRLTDERVAMLRKHGYTVDPVINSIPEWAKRLHLTHIWAWLQDRGWIEL